MTLASICQSSFGLFTLIPTLGFCGYTRLLGRLSPSFLTSLDHVAGEANRSPCRLAKMANEEMLKWANLFYET